MNAMFAAVKLIEPIIMACIINNADPTIDNFLSVLMSFCISDAITNPNAIIPSVSVNIYCWFLTSCADLMKFPTAISKSSTLVSLP